MLPGPTIPVMTKCRNAKCLSLPRGRQIDASRGPDPPASGKGCRGGGAPQGRTRWLLEPMREALPTGQINRNLHTGGSPLSSSTWPKVRASSQQLESRIKFYCEGRSVHGRLAPVHSAQRSTEKGSSPGPACTRCHLGGLPVEAPGGPPEETAP